MAMKVDFLYPFDKGFFGKTLLAGAQDNAVRNPLLKRVMPDSISDFMKHFENKMYKHSLERAPKADTYEVSEPVVMFPDMIP